MKRIALLLVLIFLSFTLSAENMVVAVGENGYAPFYIVESGEPVRGMYIDLMDAFSNEYPQYSFEYRPLSRLRMDAQMESGECDLFSLNNPMFMGDSASNFNFTDTIWETGDYLMMRANDTFEFNSIEDLFGKHLALIHGNGYGDLDPHLEAGRIEQSRVNRPQQAHRMLMSGRVDATVANIHVDPYLMAVEGIDPSQFVFSDRGLFEFALQTVVQKEHTEFLEDFNTFLAEAKQAGGLLDQISADWLE